MPVTTSSDYPRVDVIVAVRNESALIDAKLRELGRMMYPPDRLRFWIVDGGSTDGTPAAILSHAERDDRCTVVLTAVASKTAQLNEALSRSDAHWILVTDADARVPPETLVRMLSEARHDPSIGVVGTTLTPYSAHPLEEYHWRVSNRIRAVEYLLDGVTGLAVAPCYLFRRSLLDRFPADTVADDVHVVCRAAEQGGRTVLVDTSVTEMRVAATAAGWFLHKVRRTQGYLREIFRFAPSFVRMPQPMRRVLLWRALALTFAPAAALTGILMLATLAGSWLVLPAVLPAVTSASGVLVKRMGRWRDIVLAPAFPLWMLSITVTALMLYPFARPTASPSRFLLKTGNSEVW